MASLSIGNELKDSFEVTDKWVLYNLKWLGEIETFYRERAKLERDYSEKLNRLTTEFLNKKSVSSVALGVGESPTVTPGSVEAASVVAWNEILTQTELVAKDHGQLAVDFDQNVASKLNGLYTKLEMTYGKINGFYGEISDKKKNAYAALDKAKKNYDDSCSNMEAARNKHTKNNNDRSKRKMEEKEVEMNDAKNEYLIKISQANRIKDKYYFQDIPEAVDLLQDLHEAKILFLNDTWKHASKLEVAFTGRVAKRLEAASGVVAQNKPSLGTAMFIKHNTKNWKEPADFKYKPSPVWHEEGDFAVPSTQEVRSLKIKLAEAENTYNKYHDMTQGDMAKLAQFNKQKQQLKSNEDTMDSAKFYENLKSYLRDVSPFTSHETLKLLAEVCIESIQNNVPDQYDLSTNDVNIHDTKKKGGLFSKLKKNLLNPDSNHNRPTSTGHKLDIFGSVGGGGSRNKNRNSTVSTAGSTAADSHSAYTVDTTTTSAGSATAGQHSSGPQASSSDEENKVLYAYTQQDDDEISVTPGDVIELVTPDSGSGWTQIRNVTTGAEGLVPTTYISVRESGRRPPTVPPPRRNTLSMRTVTAQYAYVAQGDDELSLEAGDVVKVIKGDDGSGWTYGELDGAKGLIPTSYCK
ncbi:Bzz1p KNAG_0H03500 [Huiozyma naganishii CBS 8797]|uniref:Protein BZZ1 n=1 Tax=Huiozyma naganishii (strain ATCC MYA-139 / BCRC 22969 / CBS 8797 / KCTC 17520 / NBRC 10181 / NCYC 3082 / Yp74L-3) TaxID=1071383 RepID=J7S8V6_HUIN7|nr:hypothetical protein KNAG_0H03500 [Kazachstania naganishii CBS 8797]CCK71764.1 hypothetical protein KNAG_0H03500 [Kazachstania naganishii CBS 8797]